MIFNEYVFSFFACTIFRPEEGCLQWFTGPGGRIQSFNYAANIPMNIAGIQYSACIRKEEGNVSNYTANVLLVDFTDCVSVTNPMVVP